MAYEPLNTTTHLIRAAVPARYQSMATMGQNNYCTKLLGWGLNPTLYAVYSSPVKSYSSTTSAAPYDL